MYSVLDLQSMNIARMDWRHLEEEIYLYNHVNSPMDCGGHQKCMTLGQKISP